MADIRNHNKEGWPTYSKGDVAYRVSVSKQVVEAATTFFAEHPELSSDDVWKELADCVEVKKLNMKPEKFDPLWHARKGVNPLFLFKHWETIIAQLEEAEKLSS